MSLLSDCYCAAGVRRWRTCAGLAHRQSLALLFFVPRLLSALCSRTHTHAHIHTYSHTPARPAPRPSARLSRSPPPLRPPAQLLSAPCVCAVRTCPPFFPRSPAVLASPLFQTVYGPSGSTFARAGARGCGVRPLRGWTRLFSSPLLSSPRLASPRLAPPRFSSPLLSFPLRPPVRGGCCARRVRRAPRRAALGTGRARGSARERRRQQGRKETDTSMRERFGGTARE